MDAAISKQLSISVNAVKLYCRSYLATTTPCVNCGKLIEQNRNVGTKSFVVENAGTAKFSGNESVQRYERIHSW